MARLSRHLTVEGKPVRLVMLDPVLVRLARYGGLLRQHDFRQLWIAQGVSQFGTQVTVLALPLAAILVLHASALEVAVLEAVEFLPFLFSPIRTLREIPTQPPSNANGRGTLPPPPIPAAGK
jgi:hypothetical protein